jgi:hypothetical protein
MTGYIIIGIISLVFIILFIIFRNKTIVQKIGSNMWRILSYLLLILLLTTIFIAPEKKTLIYTILGASLITFSVNQYKRMKQYGGNFVLWFLPIILALLVALLFILYKSTSSNPI